MMANFVKLTCSVRGEPFWVNMDLVETFQWQAKPGETVLLYMDSDPSSTAPWRGVKETPDEIMDLLFLARRNHGYGFGETE